MYYTVCVTDIGYEQHRQEDSVRKIIINIANFPLHINIIGRSKH